MPSISRAKSCLTVASRCCAGFIGWPAAPRPPPLAGTSPARPRIPGWRRRTSAGHRPAGRRRPAPGGGNWINVSPLNPRGDVGVLRRDFVLADELVRQLAVDLELDRHEVVAANLAGPAGGDEAS